MHSGDTTQGIARRVRWLDYLRLLLSAGAIGLIVVGLFVMRDSSRSRGWARASGTVVSSSVNEFKGKDGVTYQPMVMYAYSVGAARYMSNRIAFRPTRSRTRRAAQEIASRYPVGRPVRVTYNPQEPDRAVLEPAGNPWIWLAAGGVLSLLTVAVRIHRGRLEKRARQ